MRGAVYDFCGTPQMQTSPLLSDSVLTDLSRRASAPWRPLSEACILQDGSQAFPVMLDLIAGARKSVWFENFIFAGDRTGRRFAGAMGAAARRGVEVRVLYDPIGTMMVKGGSAARELARQDVRARSFRPVSLLSPGTWPRLRHRDHRKTMVVDGEVAVVGGLCISDNWAGHDEGGHNWRDTALMVRGSVVGDVEIAFDAMWSRADGEDLPAPAVHSASCPGMPCGLVAADQPGAHHVAEIYIRLAVEARQSLDITDAYLVTPEPVVAAVESAARRGVRVRFLLPGNNNHPFASASARRRYARLMAAGVRIYEWRGMMVHAKTAVADAQMTLVGSSNLDPLSMTRNYELNLLVADPATGERMREMFERDLDGAREIVPAEWDRRPLWQKAAETAAGLFDGNL
ncbi:MAG: phosphatidylserine/phosphatidylglycerophosphate/cardiolipin synthase family protein [Chthoniobacterales bacterium]|nr:phosphatidylserine/phosphatidylglycerophosphate/cardiolipin synthase family protein [Chthoniobacterales bacterium]